jgi:molybdopterin-guanine dinucleotide biosynthesis protein A
VSASEPGLIVLAGGSSRRWGGRDKTAVPLLDGEPLLAHVVRQVWIALGRVATVVVAPPQHPARSVLGSAVPWVLEDPPGGGPVAGLAAGLALLDLDARLVAVLAGDLPQAGPALPRLARAAVQNDGDGAIGVDPDGRRQQLLAVFDRTALQTALDASGPPAGLSMKALLQRLRLVEEAVSAAEAFDLDTPDDFDAWARRTGRIGDDGPGDKVNDR